MKYQIPFARVNELLKRITDSWSSTKTTDIAIHAKTVSHEIEHIAMSARKKRDIIIKSAQNNIPAYSDNGYGCTY